MLRAKRLPQSLITVVVTLFLFNALQPVFPKTRRPAPARRLHRVATQRDQLRQAEDPINKIYSATLNNGKAEKFSAANIPASAFTTPPEEKTVEQVAEKEPQREKIHPALKKRIAQLAGNETETLLINFVDDEEIPRFPLLRVEEARTSTANAQVLARADQLIQQIKGRRKGGYDKLSTELRGRYRAEVLETFWLINAVLVRMPLSNVSTLAERADVNFISPEKSDARPPGTELGLNILLAPLTYPFPPITSLPFDSNPNNDVQDGRARIKSDQYLNQGLSGGHIGLLDTGVRSSHIQFNNPSRLGLLRDCTTGNASCLGGNGEDAPDCNHGTSSAAILAANANQGNAYHGVTAFTVDSFKVYSGCFGNEPAVVRGFQAALAAGNQIIVAEMAFPTSENSAISVAADKAFDAGAVVVAANGNGARAGGVNAPANAHKAIGVGAYNVETRVPFGEQDLGPTNDGRIKPDIVAPTETETASAVSNTALHVYIKTSGATPYAAGAAAHLRNWLARTSSTNDPGQVYAWMILSGQTSFPFNNTTGAGTLELPTSGGAWWGKTQLLTGTTVDLTWPLSVTTLKTFDAAIWWPESAAQRHSNLDLSLIDPSGVVRASSTTVLGVFERVRVSGNITSGTWKLRIKAHRGTVVPFSQKVYWAAQVRSS